MSRVNIVALLMHLVFFGFKSMRNTLSLETHSRIQTTTNNYSSENGQRHIYAAERAAYRQYINSTAKSLLLQQRHIPIQLSLLILA